MHGWLDFDAHYYSPAGPPRDGELHLYPLALALSLHVDEAPPPLEVRSPILLHDGQVEVLLPSRGKSVHKTQPRLSEEDRVVLVLSVSIISATTT